MMIRLININLSQNARTNQIIILCSSRRINNCIIIFFIDICTLQM